MSVELTKKQASFLRSRAHPLEPKLKLGKNGVTENFQKELERLLTNDELVKIKLGKRVELDPTRMAEEADAVVVQKVGRNLVLYRPKPEPVIQLPPA